MSGSKKLNNKSNVIAENFKKFRQESGYSQRTLCEKLELMGLQLYKADIYSIEHNKRSVKDFELLAFSIIFNKPVADFIVFTIFIVPIIIITPKQCVGNIILPV